MHCTCAPIDRSTFRCELLEQAQRSIDVRRVLGLADLSLLQQLSSTFNDLLRSHRSVAPNGDVACLGNLTFWSIHGLVLPAHRDWLPIVGIVFPEHAVLPIQFS